jgi:hypothetical protein
MAKLTEVKNEVRRRMHSSGSGIPACRTTITSIENPLAPHDRPTNPHALRDDRMRAGAQRAGE